MIAASSHGGPDHRIFVPPLRTAPEPDNDRISDRISYPVMVTLRNQMGG